jgi:hypothetical protein
VIAEEEKRCLPCGWARKEGEKEGGGEGRRGRREEGGTLRLSEKRRPCSCKEEMSSLVEAAESWWDWDEPAEDGDIATASMTEGAQIGQNPAAKPPLGFA